MAKLVDIFTDKAIRALTKPGRHPDGNGLYLYVAPWGSKSWVQRIVVNGRRRDIGLGSYPLVSLAKARDLAADNRSPPSPRAGTPSLRGVRPRRRPAILPPPSPPSPKWRSA